jgi:hypothetical protein
MEFYSMSAESASLDSEAGNPRKRMERWRGAVATQSNPQSPVRCMENPRQRHTQGSDHFLI